MDRIGGCSMATISRRELLAGLGAAAILVACGDDDDAAAPGPSSADGTPGTGPASTTAGSSAATTPGTGTAAAAPSGTIRTSAYGDPITLDPHAMGLGQPIQFAQPVYETLIRKLPDQTFVPMLATEWGYVDDERLVLEFKLRDDVTFTDGATFDANAVKANIERFKTDTYAELNSVAADVESVEVVDPTTVRFHLANPWPSALLTLSSNPAGSMISPDAMNNEDISINPVGSGPYIFDASAYVEGSEFAYDLNPDYRDGSIQGAERLEFVVMTDLEARYNAVNAGQVDMSPSSIDYVEDAEAAGLVVYRNPVDFWALFLFDRGGTITPALGDKRVRQAMNYAVDRQQILDTIALGSGRVSTQVFPDNSLAFKPELDERYPYDPDQARALLEEAGFADGFEFSAPTPPTYQTYMEALAGYLADVGITMNIEVVEGAGFIEAVVGGTYPASVFSFGSEHPHSDINIMMLPEGPLNVLGTVDEEIGRLYLEAAGSDEAGQRQLYQQINEKATEEAWFLVTHFTDSILIAQPYLSGLETYLNQDSLSVYGWRTSE
jgi:peptide/nickel transport system substrate-binding protein